MKKYFLLIFAVLLASCGQFLQWKHFVQPDIFVLPHHGLTGKNIDDFYKKISENGKKYEQIVIVSPDHFAKISGNVETPNSDLQKSCFRDACVKLVHLDKFFTENSKLYEKYGKMYEHGLGEHYIRMAKFFPETPVLPVVLRRWAKIRDTDREIADSLTDFAKNKKTLIVVSVDFSHHVREDIAVFHDKKSLQVLDSGSDTDFESLEVDCRNCLWVGKKIAQNVWKTSFDFMLRTSVDTILGTFSDTENTSHIFGEFVINPKNRVSQSEFFLFVSADDLKNPGFRQFFYQRKNPWMPRKNYPHRIDFGFDANSILGSNDEILQIPADFLREWDYQTLENMGNSARKIEYNEEKRELQIEGTIFSLEKNSVLACEVQANIANCENIALP